MALRCRPAGEGIKPPYAALAEDRCGERYGKGAPGGCQVGIRETGRSPEAVVVGVAVDVSLFKSGDIETGRSCAAGMRLAGTRVLARRCPAWRRREPDLRPLRGTWEGVPDTSTLVGRGSGPSSITCEGLSTEAGCAGGPVRSSGEVLAGRGEVGVAEGPQQPMIVCATAGSMGGILTSAGGWLAGCHEGFARGTRRARWLGDVYAKHHRRTGLIGGAHRRRPTCRDCHGHLRRDGHRRPRRPQLADPTSSAQRSSGCDPVHRDHLARR